MKDIINRAKELGICQEWADKMDNNATLGHFCKLYFLGDDWARENDFPSLDLLRKYKETENYNLYTDYQGAFSNGQYLAFFGNSDVVLEYNQFAVGYVNIRHDSKAKIRVKDHAILTINVSDRAKIEVEKDETAKVLVYEYDEKGKRKN